MLPNEYNHLANKLYNAALQNGCFEKFRTDKELLLSIQSIAFEMFDAYMKELHLKVTDFQQVYDQIVIKRHIEKTYFNFVIKKTFQDVFSDVVICVLCVAANKKIQFKSIDLIPRNNDFVLDFSAFVKQCAIMLDEGVNESNLTALFNLTLNLTNYAFLKKHIELKMIYSEITLEKFGFGNDISK